MSLGDRIVQLIQAQAAPYAQAALERGRAYGDTARQLGQIGQQTVLAVTDPARKLAALQVKEAEHAAKSRDVFEKALQDPTHYDEAGNLDEAKVGAFLKKADVGAWQHWADLSAKQRAATQEYQKKQLEIANSTLDLQSKQQAAEGLKRTRLGELAFEGMRMLSDKPDDPLHARDTALALVGRAAAVDKVISPEQAQQFALSLAQAGPGQIGQVLSSFVSPQQRAELEGKAAAQAKTEAETAKLRAEAGGTLPATPAQRETARHNAEMERINGLREGREEAAQKEQARHNRVMEGAATGAGGGAENPVAKGMAEYRIAPLSPRSMQTPAGQALMRQVMALNPNYDATQFPTRSKMRTAFTSGAQAQTINSLNTAIGHLDQFTHVIAALDNGNFTPGNKAYNWLRETFGSSAPTNFNGIKSILAGELASAFKKSGATDQEIHSVEQAINAKNSTKQLQDYVKTVALPALGSKVVSFDQQYRQVMGQDDPFRILLPESEEILRKHGIDPQHPQMGNTKIKTEGLTPGLQKLAGR